MRPALILALLLCVPALAGASSVDVRNAAFLWSLVGDADPLAPASMPDGRVITFAEAIEEAAARAGSVDLAAIASGAASPSANGYAGTLWIFEYGMGSCSASAIAPGPGQRVSVDPQTELSGGGFGSLSTSNGFVTMITDWSTKETATSYNNAGFTFVGEQDFYCFQFSGLHIAFPFGFGHARLN